MKRIGNHQVSRATITAKKVRILQEPSQDPRTCLNCNVLLDFQKDIMKRCIDWKHGSKSYQILWNWRQVNRLFCREIDNALKDAINTIYAFSYFHSSLGFPSLDSLKELSDYSTSFQQSLMFYFCARRSLNKDPSNPAYKVCMKSFESELEIFKSKSQNLTRFTCNGPIFSLFPFKARKPCLKIKSTSPLSAYLFMHYLDRYADKAIRDFSTTQVMKTEDATPLIANFLIQYKSFDFISDIIDKYNNVFCTYVYKCCSDTAHRGMGSILVFLEKGLFNFDFKMICQVVKRISSFGFLHSQGIQYTALKLLSCLTEKGYISTELVTEYKLIESAISILAHNEPPFRDPVQSNALWLLGNLAEQGFIKAELVNEHQLVKLVKSLMTKEKLQEKAFWVLAKLTKKGFINEELAAKYELMQLAESFLDSSDCILKVKALELLFSLNAQGSIGIVLRTESQGLAVGLVATVIRLLYDSDEEIQNNALLLLMGLTERGFIKSEVVIDFEFIQHLAARLLHSQWQIQWIALWWLGWLTEKEFTNAKLATECQLVQRGTMFLNSSEWKIQAEALELLMRLTEKGFNNAKLVTEYQLVQKATLFLAHAQEEVQENALWLLMELIDKGFINGQLVTECQLIQNINSFLILPHSHYQVQSNALWVLNQIKEKLI